MTKAAAKKPVRAPVHKAGAAKKASVAKKPAAKKPAAKRPAAKAKAPAKKPVRAPAKVVRPRTTYPTIVAPAPLGHLLRNDARVGDATIELVQLRPPLATPSGRIAVGDPLTTDAVVAAERVGPGPHPVVVSLARSHGEDRVVAATVHLGPGPVARWEPATAADGEAIEPTITAAAAFADADAFRAILAEPAAFPSASHRVLEHQLLTDHYVPAWGWAQYQPTTASAGNCVAFVGAAGAEPPRAWWGRDARGALCALTLDLGAASAVDA